jgi:TetR/AcrR family transcriptional repressor of nem operon
MSTARDSSPLTREAILDASIRMFQKRGFAGIGMRQIAEGLHVKAPSLYHHFPSKEALARQALHQYREQQLSSLQLIDDAGNLLSALTGYSRLFSSMLEDGLRPCLYLVMTQDPTLHESSCREELERFKLQNVEWLEHLFLRHKQDLRLPVGMREDELALLVFASLEGMMLVSLLQPEPAIAFQNMADGWLRTVAREAAAF